MDKRATTRIRPIAPSKQERCKARHPELDIQCFKFKNETELKRGGFGPKHRVHQGAIKDKSYTWIESNTEIDKSSVLKFKNKWAAILYGAVLDTSDRYKDLFDKYKNSNVTIVQEISGPRG